MADGRILGNYLSALKTEDGRITRKISFYCKMLEISRQDFYEYLANKEHPWKYQDLADAMKEIVSEDESNDTYGRIRMYQASNGKLYVSEISDCLSCVGRAVIHSGRGTQYTSESYWQTIQENHIHQSTNSARGRYHDNARYESMWARMKTELFYDHYELVYAE